MAVPCAALHGDHRTKRFPDVSAVSGWAIANSNIDNGVFHDNHKSSSRPEAADSDCPLLGIRLVPAGTAPLIAGYSISSCDAPDSVVSRCARFGDRPIPGRKPLLGATWRALVLLCYKTYALPFVAQDFSLQTSALLPMLPSLLGCSLCRACGRFLLSSASMET
jgi:hypothetical protein